MLILTELISMNLKNETRDAEVIDGLGWDNPAWMECEETGKLERIEELLSFK